MLSILQLGRPAHCLQHRRQRNTATFTTRYRSESEDTAGMVHLASAEDQPVKFTAQQNYGNMRSNCSLLSRRAVSGYVGRWYRYQGPGQNNLEADGDIIYGFREHNGMSQVWKAEEADLSNPKLQQQRDLQPHLQKDPLQLQLKMDIRVVEVDAESPLLEPSMSDALDKLKTESHPAGLAAVCRLLAVPEWGSLVVNGALPQIGAGETASPGAQQTWLRLYMRVPDADGGKRWSVILYYNTQTGDLLKHYHNYEAAIKPPTDSLEQIFEPGAHKAVLQEAGLTNRALGSIDNFYAEHKHQLQGRFTQISYNDSMECTITSSSTSSSSDSMWEQCTGGPDATEVWYDSGCYFRAPQSINPDVSAGGDVILEAGVVTPVSQGGSSKLAGIVRWLLCYSSAGERRLKWARNEVYWPQDA